MADTGARPSVMGLRKLEELPKGAAAGFEPRTDEEALFVGPSGDDILVFGTVRLTFTLDGYPFEHDFYVIKEGDLLVLGNDFLAAHGASVSNRGFATLSVRAASGTIR